MDLTCDCTAGLPARAGAWRTRLGDQERRRWGVGGWFRTRYREEPSPPLPNPRRILKGAVREVTGSDYARKIVDEVVGNSDLHVDTSAPGYVSFQRAHMGDLLPSEVAGFREQFRNQIQFVADFNWCFLAMYLDHLSGTISLPGSKIPVDVVEELVRAHYPGQHTLVLDDQGCQQYISRYAVEFQTMVQSKTRLDEVASDASGGLTPLETFAYVNGHQLVNVIASQFGALQKREEAAPLESRDEAHADARLDNDTRAGADSVTYTTVLRAAERASQAANRARWGCSLFALLAMLVVVGLATGSLNPVTASRTHNVLAEVVVAALTGLIALLLTLSLISFLRNLGSNRSLRRSVEVGTGQRANRAICPACGLSVFHDMSTLGLPIVCHTCRVAWHDGASCYRRGMPPSDSVLPSYPCPDCR